MNVVKGLLKIGPVTHVSVHRIRADRGLYFRWCYIDGARAEIVAMKLQASEHEYHQANWTPDPEHCALSQVERVKISKFNVV